MTTRSMKSGAQQIGAPKLRFLEFRDASWWQAVSLKSVCQMQAGKFVQASDISDKLEDGHFPCYGGNGLRGYTRTFTHSGKYPLIGRQGALCGNVKLATGDFHATEHAVVATARSGIDVDWLFYTLELSNLNQYATGQAQPGLSVDVLNSVLIALPSEEREQKKIAECLSTLDELIGAESQKLDALRVREKGLMQRLFPGEGETVPRLRFANDCEWTVARLPDVASFQEGPGIMAVDFRNEGVPLVRLAGVGGSEVTLDGCNYLDPEKVGQKWSHFRLAINDLIISTSATFGLSSTVTEAAAGAVFYTGLIRFRPRDEQVDRGYLKAFLGSPYFARQAESAAVGGGIKHFGPTHLQQMQIPIPPHPEQQRIASCLSSLDGLITAQRDKLEALKVHKKGLMQQLFPPPAEAQA